ncbi:MAG: hypothetical protein ABIP93_04320 [Gemmatimonadaceae bacterium]
MYQRSEEVTFARAAVALIPSQRAVIVAVPGLSALSRPRASIVATAGAETLHVTGRPVRGRPFLSLIARGSVVDCPATIGSAVIEAPCSMGALGEAIDTEFTTSAAGGGAGGVVDPSPPPQKHEQQRHW